MASTRGIRMLLGGIAASAALFAVPSLAGAVVYCVPNAAIDVSCDAGQGQGTIQAALDAAGSTTAVADTVRIGPGSYTESGLIYSSAVSTNIVTVIGAGTGQTLLTIPDTTGISTGLRVFAPSGSSVSSLAMTIPANAD